MINRFCLVASVCLFFTSAFHPPATQAAGIAINGTDITLVADNDNTFLFTVDGAGELILDGTASGLQVSDVTTITYEGPLGSNDIVRFQGANAFNFDSATFINIGSSNEPVRTVEIDYDISLLGAGSFRAWAVQIIDVDYNAGTAGASLSTGDGDIEFHTLGTGTVASDGITLRDGPYIVSTVSGDILFESMATGTNSNLRGILLGIGTSSNSVVETVSGNITFVGIGAGQISGNHGIRLEPDATVRTGNGAIVFDGTGGGGMDGDGNYGIQTDGLIEATGTGSISLTGIAGGDPMVGANNNDGVRLTTVGSTVRATSGSITIEGIAGGGENDNRGVLINTGCEVASTTGDITISGQAGGGAIPSNNNDGIELNGAVRHTAPGAGTITLTGVGGGGANPNSGNRGIMFQNNAAIVSTTDGHIILNGTGNAMPVPGSSNNDGISLNNQFSRVVATGAGDITLIGKGGDGDDTNRGINLNTFSHVNSSGGAIRFEGTGGSSTNSLLEASNNNTGITISRAGITNTLNGTITLIGVAGGNTTSNCNDNVGIVVAGNETQIQSQRGAISLDGTGGRGFNENRGIEINTNSEILTETGAITLDGFAGGGDVPLSVRNDGVWINGAVRQTAAGGGLVSIIGDGELRAGHDEENTGVYIGRDAAATVSTIDGNIEITGTGRGALQDAYNANDGIRLNRDGTRIETVSGNITLTGTGGGGEDSNRGVRLNADTAIATADGAISIDGTAGGGFDDSDSNIGIDIDHSDLLATGTGSITLTGQGGGSATDESNDNIGIRISGARSSVQSASGTISMTGSGGVGEVANRGVFVNTDVIITTETGPITLRGTGGGNGFAPSVRNEGVLINGSVEQTAAGGGLVTIEGDGVPGNLFTSENRGVDIGRDAIARVSVSGEIRITGTGHGTVADGANANEGVRITRADTLIETRSGSGITINGTGGPGEDNNHGVLINTGTRVRSDRGNIVLTGEGTGGFDDSSANMGVFIQGAVRTAGAGTITIDGIGGGNLFDASTDNDGVRLQNAGSCTTENGTITIEGLGGEGEDNNRGILVNTGSQLISTNGVIALEGSGGGGFGSGNDGSSANIGIYLINAELDTQGTASIILLGTGGGQDFNESNDNDGVRTTGAATRLTTLSGDIRLTGFGGPAENNTRGVLINDNSHIASTNGTITITGTGGGGFDESNANFGVDIVNSRVLNGGKGSITLHGTGGGDITDNSNDNCGIRITTAGARVQTDAGTISMTGIGGDGETQNRGVQINGNTEVLSNTGAILLHGTAGGGDFANAVRNDGVYTDGTIQQLAATTNLIAITGVGIIGPEFNDENIGVYFGRGTTSVVSTVTGDILVTGSGSGRIADSVDNNDGIRLNFTGSRIESLSGTITLNGTGGPGEDANRGMLLNVNTSVSTVDGAIELTGVAGGGFSEGTDGSSNNYGIDISNAEVAGTGTGTITLNGTGGGAPTDNSNDNYGVRLVTAGARVQSNSGAISITGTGGDGEVQNRGILVNGDTEVSTVTGSITLLGMGNGGDSTNSVRNSGMVINGIIQQTAAGGGPIMLTGSMLPGPLLTDENRGVDIGRDAIATVTTIDGDLVINGTGRGTLSLGSNDNDGVRMTRLGTVVQSTGAGRISIRGQGGPGEDSNRGILVNTDTLLQSNLGLIDLNGTGGGGFTGGNNNVGIELNTVIASTGAGAAGIQLTGSGGDGGEIDNGNHGVNLNNPNSRIRSLNGNIMVTGQGGASNTSSLDADANFGIRLNSNGPRIESTGTATITLMGTGGGGRNSNHGIRFETGNVGTNASVASVGGDITLVGNGGSGSGSNDNGIDFEDFGQVVTFGNGHIEFIGTSGTNLNAKGILIRDGAFVSAENGGISFTGSGIGTNDTDGVLLINAQLLANGDADIVIEGSASELVGEGFESGNAGNIIGGPDATGDITITTDSYEATQGAIQSTGNLTIQPITAGRPLWVGVGNSSANRAFLDVGDNEIDNLTDGFASITFGNPSTGLVNVDSSTFTDPVTISGRNIVVTQLDAGANDVTLKSSTGSVSEGGNNTDATGLNVAVMGTLSPGTNAVGEVAFVGDVSLPSATYAVQIDGTAGAGNAGGHDGLDVNGDVDVNGAALSVSGSFVANLGQTFLIIDNQGASAVSGTFAGLSEGAGFIGGANSYSISYLGGDGNDVVLTVITPLDPPPTANVPEIIPGGVRLSFNGVPNSSYDIEHSDTLTPPNWQVIASPTSNGAGDFSFDHIVSDPRGYYRATQP